MSKACAVYSVGMFVLITTYKLHAVCISIVLQKIDNVSILQPGGYQTDPGCVVIDMVDATKWQDVWMGQLPPYYRLGRQLL